MKNVAALGPCLAVIFATAFGAMVVDRYASHRALENGQAFALHLAAYLAQEGDVASAREGDVAIAREGDVAIAKLRAHPAVQSAALVKVVAADARYPFLRRLEVVAHTDPSRVGTRLLASSEDDKRVADLVHIGGVTALSDRRFQAGVGSAVVTSMPITRVGLPVFGLAIGALAALLFWLDLVRKQPTSRVRPLIGALLCVGTLFTLLGWRIVAIDRLEGAARSTADPIAATFLLAVVVLLPLVGTGVLGSMRGVGPSPHRRAYAYVAPALVGLSLLVVLPFLFGVALAFTSEVDGQTTFVGLDHFIHILSSTGRRLKEPLSFYFTAAVTIAWTGLNVALHLAIGLALALVLSDPLLRFRGLYRVILIVPWAVPSYITALVWKGMFNQQYGLINHLLLKLGLEPVAWFSGFFTAFVANVTTNTWLGFPFMMVTALGALQSIPKDLYEAARIDGASAWQQFRHVTLPLLRPALVPAVLLGTVWTFNMFNVIYLVSGGAPNHATDILVTEAYRWAFEQDRYGYAAAYSVLIFLFLLVWGLFAQRLTRADES